VPSYPKCSTRVPRLGVPTLRTFILMGAWSPPVPARALPARVQELLKDLRTDRSIWASAPCGHDYRLSDSELFYGSSFPDSAAPGRDQALDSLRVAKAELEALRANLTVNFVKKSVEVTIGKTVENLVPGFKTFPYLPQDCRLLFQPIDFIAFSGLAQGRVRSIDFIEIKTGHAQLTRVQRQIRDAVEDHKVEVQRS
jgi:hypothetical protein